MDPSRGKETSYTEGTKPMVATPFEEPLISSTALVYLHATWRKGLFLKTTVYARGRQNKMERIRVSKMPERRIRRRRRKRRQTRFGPTKFKKMGEKGDGMIRFGLEGKYLSVD
jgi:hypothetical protein